MTPDRADTRRRLALSLLALAVLPLHLLFGDWVGRLAVSAGGDAAGRGMPRLEADFVVELRPTPPPEAAAPLPAMRPRPPVRAAAPPPAIASAPSPDAPTPEVAMPEPVLPEVAAAPPEPPASAVAAAAPEAAASPAMESLPLAPAASAETAASAVTAAASAAAGPAPFEWPASTRLSYLLTGYYRGPVDGSARVEWLRQGSRYQVHLEVAVGPSFAPLVARRMSSDGDIGPSGLAPRRYEEETRVALRDPRRLAVQFDDDTVRLANGQQVMRPPGVQDTASQFVQLTWLFTTQPQRLRAGEAVELVLALPRRVDLWVYDVVGSESLYTRAGVIEAMHVRPRRPARPTGELTAELWVAPTLQYLPVRIVIRQDAETFVDLMLDRLPQQAADAAPR